MATEEPGARPDSESGGKEHTSSDGLGLRMIRAAMDDWHAGVLITDASGVIEYANRSFETTSGYSGAELIGRPIVGLSANEQLEQSIWAVLDAEGRWRGEIKNKRPDGEVYHLLATIQPLRSEDGEITHYIGVNIDITERVRAEEELAEREAYWRALVENAPDLIAEVDREGVIVRLNRDPEGSTAEQVVGRTVYDFAQPESHDVWRDALARAFTEGERVQFESRAANGYGEVRWYATSIAPVCTGGEVTAAIVSERDITALKEAEERMRAIATAISDVIVVVDEDGLLLEVLAPTKKRGLMLLPPEELRGMRLHEFLPKEQAERAIELVRGTVSSGRGWAGEVQVDLPQGPTWLSARSAPLRLGDGRVVAVIHILDVSERKRLEEELQRLREETEAKAEEGVKRASEYGLTFREVTVLSLIAGGKSDKE
ncbi:MAG: PAS domain S-box protein, partial [Chloroflexi bacterium]|nr:PAS domain S-box protein [Chloroflexota bacterium]